jgi:hypothetical protein
MRATVLLSGGSERGFVPGAYLIFRSKTKSGNYHDEMNFENSSKWVGEMQIPNLPPNCLIMLENAIIWYK